MTYNVLSGTLSLYATTTATFHYVLLSLSLPILPSVPAVGSGEGLCV